MASYHKLSGLSTKPSSHTRKPTKMDQEEIRQIWAEGEDWIIKLQNNQYFHRPDQKYGEWKPGLPPGVFAMDVATLFDE